LRLHLRGNGGPGSGFVPGHHLQLDPVALGALAFNPIDHFARQLPFTAYVSGRGKKNVQLTDRHVTPFLRPREFLSMAAV